MPLNRKALGKKYGPSSLTVEPEMARRYALGTNDYNPWYLDERHPGGNVAPPMIAVVYTGPVVGPVLFDEEVGADLAFLVHGEEALWFDGVVLPGDEITSTSEITAMEDKGTGELLLIHFESRKKDGTRVLRGDCGFFIRRPGAGGKKSAGAGGPAPGAPDFTRDMVVKSYQSLLYAEASGDHNPIHTSDDFARSVGLPGMILQGLCSMAFASKAVVDALLVDPKAPEADRHYGGDPRLLKMLKVRFSKPVLPGDVVTTRGWIAERKGGGAVVNLDAVNPSGIAVLKEGRAEVVLP